MSIDETSRFVRLQVELVLEVADAAGLTGAALDHIDGEEFAPVEERAQARLAVQENAAEALAYLVDPLELVNAVPGVDLAQASWTSEQIDYDPESAEWDLDDEDEGTDDGEFGNREKSEGVDGGAGSVRA